MSDHILKCHRKSTYSLSEIKQQIDNISFIAHQKRIVSKVTRSQQLITIYTLLHVKTEKLLQREMSKKVVRQKVVRQNVEQMWKRQLMIRLMHTTQKIYRFTGI